MIGLRTRQECKDNIPLLVWPVESARIVKEDFEKHEVTIQAELPMWSWLAFGLLHAGCKTKIETMCLIHGIAGVKYNVVVQ